MGEIIRAHDWAATPLGPPADWPQSLKTGVRLLLSTGHPMLIWWGPELIQFYNDAYGASLGPERHPGAVGQRGRDCWEEIWEVIGPQIDQVMRGDGATWHENQLIPITRNGSREDVYWTYSYSPLDDPNAPNSVGGVLVVCAETTQTVLSERRWRRIFDQTPSYTAIMRGPEHVYELVNAAHRRMFDSADRLGKTLREATSHITNQGFQSIFDEVYRTGQRKTFSNVVMSAGPTGEPQAHYLDFIYEPILEDDGRVSGVLSQAFDITETRKAQEALRHSEEQLRLATEMAEIGLWDVDPISDTLFWSPRVRASFGIVGDGPVSMDDFYAGLHPDDRDATMAAYAAAMDPEKRALYDVEYRTIGKTDGVIRWVAAKGRGLFNDQGQCVRVLGTTIDITARKTAELHLRLMVNELNHRVKNSLATVQAIATQTLRRADVPLSVREALTNRLLALAKAHDVLTDEKWAGAGLHEIAQRAAAPYSADRFELRGPPVSLAPKNAIAMALAFHELATNAAKYGALSVATGRVSIDWAMTPQANGERRLLLVWRESGGPPVSPPTSAGFGTRLIERGLSSELGGTVRIAYEPTGVVCEIDARLSPGSQATGEAPQILAI